MSGVVLKRSDVETFLSDYDESSQEQRRAIRFVLEFVSFLKYRDFSRGASLEDLKAVIREDFLFEITRKTIKDYIEYLEKVQGYSSESVRKRLVYVGKLLERVSPGSSVVQFIRENTRSRKRVQAARRLSLQATLSVGHIKKFFKELEALHREGKISDEPYWKSVLLARIIVDTGEWKQNVALLRNTDIDFENGTVEINGRRYKLSKETMALARYYVRKFGSLISYQGGLLFVQPRKRDVSTLYINKIMRKYKERLKFDLGNGQRFEFDMLRVFGKGTWMMLVKLGNDEPLLSKWTREKINGG